MAIACREGESVGKTGVTVLNFLRRKRGGGGEQVPSQVRKRKRGISSPIRLGRERKDKRGGKTHKYFQSDDLMEMNGVRLLREVVYKGGGVGISSAKGGKRSRRERGG